MNNTRIIEGAAIRLEYVGTPEEHFISIYMNGDLWDWHSFQTEEEARAFMADPFKEQRAKNEDRHLREMKQEAEAIGYYASDYTRISRGRQVGPNKR